MQELAQGWKMPDTNDIFENQDNYIVSLDNVEYHIILVKTLDCLTLKIVANENRLALVFPNGDYISDFEENNLGRLMHYADEYLVNRYWRECHEQSNFVDTYEMVNIDECKAAEIEKIKESQENAARAGREAKIVREISDIQVDVRRLIDRVCALESRGYYPSKNEETCLNAQIGRVKKLV